MFKFINKFQILQIVSIIISLQFVIEIRMETLKGVTILNWPYVSQKTNGQFEGFCIDLLNELAPLMGITYTLSLSKDGQYGGWLSKNGSINGMIGEVMNGEVDFAIGDLTVLSTRARFVDFTLPFMEYGLTALVRREILNRYGKHIRTFKDLSEQTDISYGVKKHGANLPLFHDSPVVAKMYSYMDTHPSTFVDGEREGLQRVKTSRYAFITESPYVEYLVERDCDLVAIDDRRRNFQFEYAIAVAKNSPLKDRFNRAIRQLRNSGKIRELKEFYWRNSHRNCPHDLDYNPNIDQTMPNIRFMDHNKQQSNNNNEDNSQQSGRLRQSSGRLHPPHDRVDDDDVELIKPKPDRTTIHNRRPINRPNFHRSSSMSSLLNVTISNYLILITLLSLIVLFNY